MPVRIQIHARQAEVIAALLVGLMRASMVQLRGRTFPRLYDSGVRYRREPMGSERWQTAEETLMLGHGDCEDLASWRAAELRVSGEDVRATPVLKRVRPGLMHCLVRRGDGSLEDPSRRLGMKGKG